MTVLDVVANEGYAVVPIATDWSQSPEMLRDAAAASPFGFAARLLGVEPLLVERQPIRPIDGGRSFASTRIDTPLHTDSQMFAGAPAAIQILVWLGEPLPADPRHVARARAATPAPDRGVTTRLRAVLAILRGVPPAKVAFDSKIDEATLYGWRDAFTSGGIAALANASKR